MSKIGVYVGLKDVWRCVQKIETWVLRGIIGPKTVPPGDSRGCQDVLIGQELMIRPPRDMRARVDSWNCSPEMS